MKFFILTDIEGVAGVDSFSQTRTRDEAQKALGMTQLAREVNACTEGIHTLFPDAQVDVWDGHGSGAIRPHELRNANYLREGKPYYNLAGYAAMLFVGQHAMAGTAFAPLCHTYSSLNIAYYRLNGIFIGEFGARALIAGMQGVPTIFLSGDDKATLEARMFIPEIETVAVKKGLGLEAAEHLDPDEACRRVKEGTIRALERMSEIPPFRAIEPPYTLEVRRIEPPQNPKTDDPKLTWIDSRTYRIVTDDLRDLPF